MDTFNSILILIGSIIVFLGNVGLLRLPDFFCRSHALTKSMTLGVTLLLIGTWLSLGTSMVGLKIAVVLVFQYLTIPLSGHILGFVAFRKNIPRWKYKDVK